MSSYLLHSKDFHYKRSTRLVYSNSITYNPQEYTAPRSKPSVEPTTDHWTIQTPLYNPENTLLIPSASFKLYRTLCTHIITTPGNSHQNRIQWKIYHEHNNTSTSIQNITKIMKKRYRRLSFMIRSVMYQSQSIQSSSSIQKTILDERVWMVLITKQEGTFLSLKTQCSLIRKWFRMISCLFSKTCQLFIDNCLRIQSIVLPNSRLFFSIQLK